MSKSKKTEIELDPITINDFKKCGVHIPCYQASNMEWKQQEKFKTEIKYDAVIPFSLDLIYLFNIAPDIFYRKGDQIYTEHICSVKFDKDYQNFIEAKSKILNSKKNKIITYKKTKDEVLISHNDLRTQFYNDGFKMYYKSIPKDQVEPIEPEDYINYVQYKRSSSKSRLGSCLFIEKDLYSAMINWSRMNIEFPPDVEVPLADLKSYESLPLSSLEQLINVNNNEKYNTDIYQTIFNLQSKNILCVNDVPWEITYPASITKLDEFGMPQVNNTDNHTSKHDIHDGQGLLDYSLIENTPFKDKCMFLLRERFLKCAAFSTDIQKFYKDQCIEAGRDYETATTLDMFQQEHLLKDIKLIITPNSLKLLKYDLAKFVKDDSYVWNDALTDSKNEEYPDEKNVQCRAFNYWLKHIDLFGVVKHEHSSKWNQYQQATYQYLNSLPLTKDDIKGLLEPESQYINALKNDILVFKHHANCHHVSYNKSFIFNMLAVNPKVENTSLFKEWRRKVIRDYVNSLKTGAIKIFGDYCTLISSPYEMLCLSYGMDISKPIVKPSDDLEKGCLEVYTTRFSENEQLSIWRNPNINQGNIIWGINKGHNEYRYFHLNDNILVISAATPFCEQAQGADEDSDSCMVTNVPILVKESKEINQSGKFYIPINGIKIPKTNRMNTPEDSADIDNIINESNADIGIVCNWAALLNSLYWDCKSKGYSQNILNEIYDKSSLCSSLSQLAIDRSKKFYTNKQVNIGKCLKTIYDIRDRDGIGSLIKTIELKKRSNNLTNKSDEDCEKVEQLLEDYKARRIKKDELESMLDDLLVTLVKKKNGEVKEVIMRKPIRPYYFSFLKTGDKRQCVKKDKAWNCPMDFLNVLLDGINVKNDELYVQKVETDTIPLNKILYFENNGYADRKQVDVIFGLVREYENDKNQLWNPMTEDYKTTKQNEKELYDNLSDKIKKKKIRKETIEYILYLCYIAPRKKTSIFYIDDKKEKAEYYSKYALTVCGLLWETHANTFKKAFENAHNKPVDYLIPCESNDYGADRVVWGKDYKIVQYTPEQIQAEEKTQSEEDVTE